MVVGVEFGSVELAAVVEFDFVEFVVFGDIVVVFVEISFFSLIDCVEFFEYECVEGLVEIMEIVEVGCVEFINNFFVDFFSKSELFVGVVKVAVLAIVVELTAVFVEFCFVTFKTLFVVEFNGLPVEFNPTVVTFLFDVVAASTRYPTFVSFNNIELSLSVEFILFVSFKI